MKEEFNLENQTDVYSDWSRIIRINLFPKMNAYSKIDKFPSHSIIVFGNKLIFIKLDL